MFSTDRIIMTPLKKEVGRSVLRFERKLVDESQSDSSSNNSHVAGGNHQGIIINKDIALSMNSS